MPLDLIISTGVTLLGWAVCFGVMKNKIDSNEKAIADLKADHKKDIEAIHTKQNQTDVILQSINTQLASLNTKVDMILKGQVQVKSK